MTTVWLPVFATPNPLLIAGVREVLTAAGFTADPQIVAPDGLVRALALADHCLVLLDGQALPRHDALAQMCQSKRGSYFVIWAVRPTADLLKTALECGVHGLLSSKLPPEEASRALLGICKGEQIFRFDPDLGPTDLPMAVKLSARERHVLLALVEGATNSRIAAELHTSASTVKGCLSRMFRKTGARNRRELAELSRSLMPAAEQRRKPAAAATFDELWMLENL